MRSHFQRGLCAGFLIAASAAAAPAFAADEEIQVYMNEMNQPGHFGLDVHTNWVVSGDPLTDFAGQQQSLHRVRITPEFSLGMTPYLELGGYLPLTTIQDGKFDVGGVKGRLKFIAPHADDQDWWWGINFELGKVEKALDINPWNAELKGIIGTKKGPWTLAANLNYDWAVSGPAKGDATIEVATKVSYAVSDKTALGIENYNGLGPAKHIGHFSDEEQAIYATLDTSVGRWDFNLGVGRGYGSNPDKWTLKAIFSVPIDPRD